MKKYLSLIVLFGLICFLLVGCEGNKNNGAGPEGTLAEKALSELETKDIKSFKVTIYPPDKEKTIKNSKDISKLITILNKVVAYEQDDSHVEYGGQWVEFELKMMDGSLKTVAAYNPFIVIDGVGYRTEYGPCEELNAFGNSFFK